MGRLYLTTIASKALPSDPFQYENTCIIINYNINENIIKEKGCINKGVYLYNN